MSVRVQVPDMGHGNGKKEAKGQDSKKIVIQKNREKVVCQRNPDPDGCCLSNRQLQRVITNPGAGRQGKRDR